MRILYKKDNIKVFEYPRFTYKLEMHNKMQLVWEPLIQKKVGKKMGEEAYIDPLELLKDKDKIDVLVIGLGAGKTVQEVLKYPNINKIDVVEIEEKVKDILKFFESDSILNNEKINIIIEDAKDYVKKEKRYDFIAVDVCQPCTDNSKEIWTKLFYENLKKNCFKEDTISVLWNYSISEYVSIFRSLNYFKFLKDIFKNCSFHYTDDYKYVHDTFYFFSDKYIWNKTKIETMDLYWDKLKNENDDKKQKEFIRKNIGLLKINNNYTYVSAHN